MPAHAIPPEGGGNLGTHTHSRVKEACSTKGHKSAIAIVAFKGFGVAVKFQHAGAATRTRISLVERDDLLLK